jgi:hypothetical protein
MITQTDIVNIFNSNIPKGKVIPLSNIQDIVKSNFHLTADDWEPHTQTRPTKYPRWVHRVQGTLDFFKDKNLVIHDPVNKTYTFI